MCVCVCMCDCVRGEAVIWTVGKFPEHNPRAPRGRTAGVLAPTANPRKGSNPDCLLWLGWLPWHLLVDPCQVSWLALPPSGHPGCPRAWGWSGQRARRQGGRVAKALVLSGRGSPCPTAPPGKQQDILARDLWTHQDGACGFLPAFQREAHSPSAPLLSGRTSPSAHRPRDTSCPPAAPVTSARSHPCPGPPLPHLGRHGLGASELGRRNLGLQGLIGRVWEPRGPAALGTPLESPLRPRQGWTVRPVPRCQWKGPELAHSSLWLRRKEPLPGPMGTQAPGKPAGGWAQPPPHHPGR